MPCRRTPSVVRRATSSEEEHAPLVEMCEGGVCPSAHATGHAMHNRSRAFDSKVRSVGIWQPLRWPSSLWCPQPAPKGALMTRHLWYALKAYPDTNLTFTSPRAPRICLRTEDWTGDRLVSVWLPFRPGERAGPCPAPSARLHPAGWRLCRGPARRHL